MNDQEPFVLGEDVAFTSRGGRRMVGWLLGLDEKAARVQVEWIDGEFREGSLVYNIRAEKLERPTDDE